MKNTNLKLFELSKLANTVGNLVFPIITYILLKTLKIEDSYIGVIIMIVSVVKIPGIMIGGKLGDTYDKRYVAAIPPIVAGAALISSTLLMKYKYVVVVLMCTSKFMSGIASPSNTKIMAGLTDDSNRRNVFAKVYMITNIGTALSSLIGGFIYSYSCILVFLLDGITRIISGLLLLFIKDVKFEKKDSEDEIVNETDFNVLRYMKTRKGLWGYIFLTLIFIYIYSQYSYAIPLKLDETFASNSSKLYSIVLFINCITVVFLTKLMVKLCKKKSAVKCLEIAFICFMFGFGFFIFNINIATLVISTIIWSLGEVIFGINELVYISEGVDEKYLARVMSIYDGLHNLITAISPMLNSFFVVQLGLKNSWIILTLVALTGAIITFLFNKRQLKIL